MKGQNPAPPINLPDHTRVKKPVPVPIANPDKSKGSKDDLRNGHADYFEKKEPAAGNP